MFSKALIIPLFWRFQIWVDGVLSRRNLIYSFVDKLDGTVIGAVVSIAIARLI